MVGAVWVNTAYARTVVTRCGGLNNLALAAMCRGQSFERYLVLKTIRIKF
ncbi:MAG: hypothetical protein WCC57_15930 [Paracoccaceae bacterium]